MKSQEILGIPMKSQEILGNPRNSQEIPRKSQEILGNPRNVQEISGNFPGISQEFLGISQEFPRNSQEFLGCPRNFPGIPRNFLGNLYITYKKKLYKTIKTYIKPKIGRDPRSQLCPLACVLRCTDQGGNSLHNLHLLLIKGPQNRPRNSQEFL